MRSHQKTPIYFADFETLTVKSKEFQNLNHTGIWLWCICEYNNEKFIYGNTMNEFFNNLIKDGINKIIYFHNLSFDGDFIYKYLLKEYPGWYRDLLNNKNKKYNFFEVFRNGNRIYSIIFSIKKKINGKTKIITLKFLCSYNLIPASIESLGDGLNIKKHNDNDLNKLIENKLIKSKSEFYDLGGSYLFKSNNETDKLILNIFIEYIKRDVYICKQAYKTYQEVIENNNPDSYNNRYKKQNVYLKNTLTAATLIQKLLKNNLWNNKHLSKEIKRGLKVNYDNYILGKNFYSGGLTQFNPEYKNSFVENGLSIDINSSYPYAMTKPLPYGNIYTEKEYIDDNNPKIWYVKVKCFFQIKEKYRSIICIKSKTPPARYATSGVGEYYWTEQEFNLLKKIYNIDVKHIERYWCYTAPYLKPFIDKYYQYKVKYDKEHNKALKQTYKILLNSLYGSFAKKALYPSMVFIPSEVVDVMKETMKNNPDENYMFYDKKSKSNYIIDSFTMREHVDNGIKYQAVNYIKVLSDKEKEKNKMPNMIVGATITSYARIYLLETILKLKPKNFIYCDTDSIFFKWNKPETELNKIIEIDDYKLGAWKVEFKFIRGKILGAKRYVFENRDHKVKAGICGVKNNFTKYDEIESLLNANIEIENAKLQIKRDEYGIYLIEKDIIMKEGQN